MQWHEFAFSKKRPYLLLRHSVFWAAWWLYFALCQFLYQQPAPGELKPLYVTVGSHIFIKTFFLVLLTAPACYIFIYLLLPQIVKGKRWKAAVNVLLLCICLCGAGYWMYWTFFPFIDSLFGRYKPNRFPTRFWPAVSLGLWEPLKVVAAAGIIRYMKYWWLKQQESEKLEREKIDAELQLLKAQIHPGFLFTSLTSIYTYSLAASPRAPQMLLKLSDLLSYMLYECDQSLVALEKEITMMKDYIALEKIRLNDAVEMELSVRGDITGKMIAPFILLPFIENSFKHSTTLTERPWMNMDISIDGDFFYMKLANGILAETNSEQIIAENSLANVQKRLTLIYPQKHELKISREAEMLIVLLKIQLAATSVIEFREDGKLFFTEPVRHQSNLYAAQ